MIISFHHGTRVGWVTMDVDTWDKIPIKIHFSFFPLWFNCWKGENCDVALLLANSAAVYCFDER